MTVRTAGAAAICCHTNATSHSLSRDDQVAAAAQRLASTVSVRHRIVIPVAKQKCFATSLHLNQRKRDDNKNKICAFQGGALLWGGGQRGKSSKTLFFVGNATTIKFKNSKFYCRKILLSWRRLLLNLPDSISMDRGARLQCF